MTIINGELVDALQLSSPHFNTRPAATEISLLVIHNISLPAGQFGGSNISDLFLGKLDCHQHPSFESLKAVKVSAHLLIDRHGRLTQFVNFGQRAWHAGISSFNGVENCNDYSIGIELEGTDEVDYSSEQYKQLSQVTRSIIREYPKILPSRICGHNEIAPGRKTDPGPAFDWHRYMALLKQ
jgi:AmpD protein